jgi:hypothetical protein
MNLYIRPVALKITEILIMRAVEKGIIKKLDKTSWFDIYVVIEHIPSES